MKFIRDLLGKKNGQDTAPRSKSIESLEQSYRDSLGSGMDAQPEMEPLQLGTPIDPVEPAAPQRRVVSVDRKEKGGSLLKPAPKRPEAAQPAPAEPAPAPAAQDAAAMNIWDIEDDVAAAPQPKAEPAPAPAPRSPARSRRTKTRLIGFERSDGDVVDLFDDAPKATPAKSTKFPVGWIVVADGPGRGESIALQSGMSSIGRGEDQAVQLDFGDSSISRSNHAAIVFDPDSKEFLLGHGGKSNIVRLNDKPLISNESLKTGDVIRIGETTLRFVALCGKDFNWSDGATGGDEDVAIA